MRPYYRYSFPIKINTAPWLIQNQGANLPQKRVAQIVISCNITPHTKPPTLCGSRHRNDDSSKPHKEMYYGFWIHDLAAMDYGY